MQSSAIQLYKKNHQTTCIPSSKQNQKRTLNIVSVQRTCVHDGPGIRTTIFFRGCNLSCIWCQNPEARLFVEFPGSKRISDSEVLSIIDRDVEYLHATGGGVTLSGGEPLLQPSESLCKFLKELRKRSLSVAVETTLHVPWRNVERIVPFVDLFLVDLKVVGDDEKHKRFTGARSTLIHHNIKRLLRKGAKVQFRMVIVPGYNNSPEDIFRVSEFLKSLGFSSIELLKYHNLYETKAQRFGIAIEKLNISPQKSIEALHEAIAQFKSQGIDVISYDLDYPRKKAVFTQRVYDIQNDIRESDHHLCFEVAKLKTKFYRTHGFKKPNPIHRAERLKYVLSNKKIIIYPKELLVGNFTSKRKGGQVWEEHYGVLFVSILHQIHKQKPVPFKCSFRDKLSFYFNIFPFWLTRGILGRVNKTLREFMLLFARNSEMNAGFNNNMAAIAHFIVNYDRVLEKGTRGIIEEIQEAKKKNPARKDFYDGMIISLEALEVFASRYAEKLRELSEKETDPVRRDELRKMMEICSHVPKYPARTFHEALQSMLFLHIALCIESYENAISPGRLDQLLYPYYKRDVEAGILDYEKAKELLALFILKLDEAILVNDGDTYLRIGRLFETMSTDQTVTMGGVTPTGEDATNDVTYMLLDICELQPYAVNMAARIHKHSPKKYLRRIAEVYLNGAPMPVSYTHL
ncbi:MAG: radical SAM protein, partial [Spirochaetes bacterium]|nr:radical SAM protein [Spirochaetota bacterium]